MTPETFKDTRKKLGMSQQAMAEALGFALKTIQRWEAGDKPIRASVAMAVHQMVEAEDPNPSR